MKLIRAFTHSGIRSKLTIILLVITLIPLSVMFVSNRLSVESELRSQSSQTYARSLMQVSNYVSDKAGLARSLLSMLCGDVDVQEGTNFDTLSGADYESAWFADISQRGVVYSGYLLGAVSRVYLYNECVGTSFQNSSVYHALSSEQQERFRQWVNETDSPCMFLIPEGTRYVYLLTKVPSTKRLGIRLGLLQGNISISIFEDILKSAPGSPNTTFYLLDGYGRPFIQTASTPVDKETMEEVLAQLEDAQESTELTGITLAGETYMAGIAPIQGTDWHAVMLVPNSDMTDITRHANAIMLMTVLLLLVIILLTIPLITRSFTKPIFSLRQGVLAIAEGDYSVTVPPCATPEINQVIVSFNLMVKRTQEMMIKQYEMGQNLKNAELQVLQEQINPHFLYNTLDLLHWQARKAGAKDIGDVVYALSEFYKLSLGRGETLVSIDHELRHISAYMRIQNIRFANQINLVVDVPQEVRNCTIVKITLQPLVENCIQHGIREKDDEQGTVTVRGRMDGHDAVLSIHDDGVGMDAATLARLYSGEIAGAGVRNVNQRLLLHYGSLAQLRYTSTPGKGTIVTFRIPVTR